MRIITVVDEGEVEKAYDYLENLIELARLKGAESYVEIGTFEESLQNAPQADLDLFGLADEIDLKQLRSYVDLTKSACVFVADSGKENVLA